MRTSWRYFDVSDVKALLKAPFYDQRNLFEKEFAEYLGARHAISTSHGRTALYLGLRAIGAEGGEVLLPAFACTVVRQAIVFSGAVPKFVDVDFETFDIDLNDAQNKVSPKTKALIFIHYFGRVARNLKAVREFARRNKLVLIEDCAHSLGAEYKGQKIGTFGDFSIFSLTKNMINCGGGFLVTDNEILCAKAREILLREERRLIEGVKGMRAVFTYGLEQMIRKLYYDRVENGKREWCLQLPNVVFKAVSYFLVLLELPLKIRRRVHSQNIYDQGISMARVIASLGRNQLKKIDILIGRRRAIYGNIAGNPFLHCRNGPSDNAADVYTHLVFRVTGHDIYETIIGCRENGLSLSTTWTARQEKWKHLESTNMNRIQKEILVMSLNPDLTEREIENVNSILGRLERQEAPKLSAPQSIKSLKL